MGKSNTLVANPATDIRAQVEESLSTLNSTVSKAERDYYDMDSKMRSWNVRISRAKKVLERVSEEGREATETLLKQAEEIHAAYQAKSMAAAQTWQNLKTHRNELKKASDHFKIAERQAELKQRISGINAITSTAAAIGDEKTESYDVRELARTIHTIQALIELQGGKS